MHGKERAVAPAFGPIVGLNVVATAGVDTDVLGTFSGETLRRGTMLETAVAKARLGVEATGLRLAIASEGSFGPHPQIFFMPAGIELLVLVDVDQGLVIHETMLLENTNLAHLVAAPGAPINAFRGPKSAFRNTHISCDQTLAIRSRGWSKALLTVVVSIVPSPLRRTPLPTAARESRPTCVRISIRRG